jgi:hypothetical protein
LPHKITGFRQLCPDLFVGDLKIVEAFDEQVVPLQVDCIAEEGGEVAGCDTEDLLEAEGGFSVWFRDAAFPFGDGGVGHAHSLSERSLG